MEVDKVREYIFQLEQILDLISLEIEEVPESEELINIGYMLCGSLKTILWEVEDGIQSV